MFDGKATNKDAFEKIAEQFTKASGFLVKRWRGACKRMGLVTIETLSSQTVTPRIPNRNFPKFFVNGKRPECMGLRIRECLREVGNPGSIRVMASLQVLEIIWSQRENHKGYIGLRVRWGITGEIEFRGRLAIGQREVRNHRKY